MLDLPMIRFMYPQYNGVSDYELSKAYHQKYHPEMPYDQFAKEFDGPLQEDKIALAVKKYNLDNPEHPITKDKIRDLKGFWDYVGLGFEGGRDSLADDFLESVARAWRGGNIDPNNETWADRTIRQQQKDNAARIPTRQEIEGDALANALYQGPKSVATSLATTLGGAAIGGAAGTAVGGPAGAPVGGVIGAGTLSGLVYYRSAKDKFVSEVHDKITELRGKPLTSEEAARLNVAIEDDAVKAGLYEAAPEALSSAFTTLLFGGGQTTKLLKQLGLNGLGKIGEKVGAHALTRIPAKLAAEIGEEEITEGITYGLQETQRKEYGLRDTDPSLGEFIETQAGPIAVGSLLQAGGMKLASKLANRNKVSPFVPPSEETESTPPSAPKPLTLEELRVLSNSDPSYDGAEKFISPWREKTTQTAYPPVIRSDQPVDLLSFGNTPMAGLAGLEKNTSPTSRAALPEDYIDVDYSVIPEGQGAFPPLPQHQLPTGTGRQSGFNGAGPEAPLQGLSFLASPQMYQPQPEMPSTFPLPGNVGGKPGPQFSPTGGVPQLTPRADTTNKALALGMAAPDMMPVPHRGLINLPFMRGATPTAPVNTPQLPPLPTVTQPQRLVEPEFTFSSSSSPAQPALESPVSPRPTPNIARAMTMAQRLQSGTMTPEELRTVYEAYRRNHPALAHELSLMSRSTLLSWVPPDMKRAARRSKRQKIAQMLLEYMDGLFSRSNTIPTNLKEEKRDARSEEQKYGRTEDQGAITQPGLEPNYSQPNEQPSVVMGNGERRKGEPEHNAVTVPQRTQIAIPNRGKADVTYEIVEADALKTSHLPSAGFQKNPAYALENERRYHDEPASQAKVMENAAQLDPAFLMDSVDANHGAPVVDREGNVLGGNGRAMSISRAYESFPERGKQYREALKAKAEKLGIDPAQIDAMRSPVLVRRLDRAMAPEERQQFVTAMNDDFKASREKKAEGKTRGDRLSPATIDALAKGLRDTDSLREFFDSPKSASIVERLLADGVIQPTERNVYIGADGLLNPDGKGVVEAALRGRIARNYETLALLPADIQGKLDAAIPHILVAEGVGGKWNITEHVRDAVDLLAEYKKSGIKEPVIFLKQVNMLTGTAPVQNASKESLAIFQMALQGKKSEFAKAFAQYASEAKRSPEAGGIPGVAKPQDRAFRDAFGMEPEPSPAKPKMKEEGEPQAKERPKEQPPQLFKKDGEEGSKKNVVFSSAETGLQVLPNSSLTPQKMEGDDGRDLRSQSGRKSLVENAPGISDGQRTAAVVQDVQGVERSAFGTSGRNDSKGSASEPQNGRDSTGHPARDNHGTALPVRGSELGRGTSYGGTERANMGVGGEPGKFSADRGRGRKTSDNHHIAPDDVLVPGGTVARAKANIEAVRLLKKLDVEKRDATPEEKKLLAQFTGWGSLAQEVFNADYAYAAQYEKRLDGALPPALRYADDKKRSDYARWKKNYGEALHPDLGGMMTAQEWDAAEKSTLNAHYTDRKVIEALWGMAEKLGFRGGRVLEPSAGTGLFFGLMPEHLSERSSLVGVELDTLTGGILGKLYPDADIQVTGFENAKRVGDNTLDLVISNVPFGNFRVTDRKRPQYAKQSIHNYFISRSIDAARPGGLVMEITSHFTLDSLSGAPIREEWGRKADLVAAIRLPGTAFEKNAGTQVTTDILIFRKNDSGLSPVSNAFRNVETVETPDGPATVNEYFVQHPEMVLGEHSLQGSMYGENEYTLKPRAGERLEDGLKRALEALPANVFGEGRAAPVEREQGIADAGMREGALVEKEGKLLTVADGALISPEWADKPRKVKQAKSYVGVKQSVFDLINAMNSDAAESEIGKLRTRLNAVYDAYVKEYGPINKNGNGFLEDDIEFPTVAAIESTVSVPVTKTYKSGKRKGQSYQVDEKRVTKADIFDKRTIFPFREPTSAENVQDAIKISRIFRTGIDVGYVGKLLGMGPEAARAELLKSENVFENPETGLIEPDDVYLSGNVRKKLEMAEARREDNPAYEKNVEALRKVQPDRIGIDAIHARLGSSWVPAEVYKGFVEHLGFSGVAVEKVRLEGEEGSTQWHVEAYGGTPEARNRWGVDGASALDLISDGLNLKRTEIYDETYGADGKPSRVKNTEKTLAAQEKQRAIQNEFQSWLKKDDAAGKLVEDEYNDTFNGFVPRKFTAPDIKHFPGASHAIELRENQKIGVVRGLQESTLLAHGVGSGKTMLQITLAMEMRRLGTAKKPWIVVQASTLSQFAATFKTLYPRANILAPTEKQRNAKNRQRLLAQIASGDWDAVVTPHGFFNSISIDPQNEACFIEAQIEEYKDSLRTDFNVEDIDKKKSSESRTVKQIRKKIEKLRNRLEALSNTRKDENIYFEQLGVDALIIDEAHVYKRGSFYTKMDNVKGLDRDSSQRSMQMLMKARHVQAKTGGKNVVLATGTPISNTLTEMWTMFRYTRPDLLKEFGVEQFDDFASAFADTSVDLEETATGEFKQVERFNKFVNGPELLTLWRSGADVALTEDLDYIKGLPKLKEGRIHEVTVERSESLSNYIEALRQERAEWDRLSGKEKRKQSSVPLQIYGKAKKAAIDLRLVDSALPDEPVSKANKAVENIHDRWEENRDTKAAQIVFCDNFRSGDGAFNLFEDIKGKLIARGVPKGEIAIIHDFKTDEARKRLFDAVNRGDVRILMGTTEKLGVGVNVQERLLTAHHLDAPPRPMDFEQRNGRIRRPGNIFPEVEILTYGTRNTLDSVTFQQLISKQKFINQLLRGDVGTRSFENPFDATQATFEDMMAAFSGNPLAKEKMQLQVEVRRLEALNAAYESRLGTLRHNLRSAKSSLAFFEGRTKSAEAVTAFIRQHFPDGEIEGRKELSKEVSSWLDAETKRIEKALSGIKRYAQWQVKNPADDAAGRTVDLGNRVSAEVSLLPSVMQAQDGTLVKGVSMSYQLAGPHGIKEAGPFNGAVGLFTRLRNDLARYAGSAAENAAKIKGTKAQIASLEEELKRPFEQKKELEDARERMAEIEQKLAETSKLNGVLFSVKPGEFLNDVPPSRLRVRKAAVRSVVDALGKRAVNAAETRVVQSFEELPEHIRRLYGDAATRLEGVYDPATATVYLVADNLRSTGRAAEVWMHENLAHHGLNGLVGKGEKRRILNRLWQRMGGLGNADLKEIAHRYGVDPRSDADARELVMEEYVAHLAEKRAADKLSGQDQTYWRRFVEAVLRAWNAVVDFVAGRTGTMRYENLDRLLSALDQYVFEGKPEGVMEQGGTVSAMESRRVDPNNARFSPDTGKATDFVTLPDGSVDFAQFPEIRLMDYRLMKAASVRLQRGRHNSTGGNFGLRHIEANHGEDIRNAGYQNVQEFIWDLVNNFDEIWEGEGKSFLLIKRNTNTKKLAGFIRLEKTGEFYSVSTAFPAALGYPNQKTRKRLWSRDQHATPTTGEQAPFNPFRAFRNPIQGQTGNLQGQRGQSVSTGIQHGGGERKPKASLRDIGSVKDIIGLSAKDALNIASNDPHIGKFFSRSEDVTLMQRIFMLPHWLAKKYPNFKTVYERQLQRMDERATEVASSLQEIPSLFDGNNLSNEDMSQLNKLVWDNDGKQIAELEEIDKFLTDEKLDNGRTTITTNPEWYEGYDEWLNKQSVSESVKKAMREIRRSLDNDLVRAHNRLAGISEMNDGVIQGFRTQAGHIHNYFPHHRYGDYYIQGKDKDGNVVFREHFDALTTMKARQQAVKRIEELEKEYPDAIFDSGKNTKLPDEAFGRIIDPEAMEQIIKAALAKVSDKEQASKIAEVLHESVADVIKSTGWGSHAIRRKNIPGFEKDDLYRVLYDYKSGLSGWLTKMEASRDFATALSNINAKSNPNEWSYASQYVKDMLRNSDAIDRGVGKVKTLAFAWYLGANLKTAVVNLTQNIIIGVPRLEMDVTSGARYYIRGAQKQIVNQLDRRFHDKNSNKGLSEEEAQLIKELYGDSVITDAYMEEVRGHMSGGKNARMWNKLMKFMGYPMSVAERFNRGSLALAAFRAAREGKLKPAAMRRYGVGENGIATYEQAKAFAEDVVRDSHYVYGKSNAPELLRSSAAGRGLGAAFTFKTFTANTVGLWYWALTTQGMEGAKMVGKGLAALPAMGGLVSLPLYTTLQALAQALSGDDDDWTETIRRNLPEDDLLRDVVCYGLPASVGVNLGGSLKMELAITRGMQRGSTPKEVLTEGIGDIIGIPWDLFIEKPSKVIDAVRVDSAWRAIESMAPTFVSNAMKGYRLVTEGQKTLKGKDINEPGQKGPRKLTELEGLGMLLGFQPVSNTKSYDSYNARQHADKIRSEKIGEVALKMLKAKEADDLAGMAAAKRIMLEWNKKMEAENKPWMKFALKDMRRRMVALRRERSLSKRQRQQLKETVW